MRCSECGRAKRLTKDADYNDFFNYKFPVADELPINVPRPALDVGEAIRLILMKIHVTRIETSDNGSPIVYFTGFSRSLDGSWDDNADSDLRGELPSQVIDYIV